MMKITHSPHHWVHVAVVAAAALLVFSEAHGQKQDAAATFEGRPALAGAQAGQGALAGPPQGFVGTQGTVSAAQARDDRAQARGDVAPKKDTSLAKEQRSAARKVKKAAKRVVKQKGIPPIESRTGG